jgi:hypothetical protein
MRHTWSIWAAPSLSLLSGCAPLPDADPEGPPRPREQAVARDERLSPDERMSGPWRRQALDPDLLYPVPDLLAWTKGGDLALVDGRTGEVRQSVPTLELAGGRDVAYEPAARRAWIAESVAEGALGEVASYPVIAGAGRAKLGPRAHHAWLAGEARLLPSPLGVVAFEEEGGGRWRLLSGGAAGAPVSAPQPMSAWTTASAGVTTVHALAYGEASGELDAVTAAAHPGALALAGGEALGVDAGTLPACARVVPTPLRGGALLIDVSGSFLSVRPASGASVGAAAIVPLGASGLRVEDAVSLRGGALVAVLLSGTTEVVALDIDAELQVVSMATLPLPGHVAPSTRFVAHDLAEQGYGRIVAATSAGLFSIQIRSDPIGVRLELATGFEGGALRGPIAPVWSPN